MSDRYVVERMGEPGDMKPFPWMVKDTQTGLGECVCHVRSSADQIAAALNAAPTDDTKRLDWLEQHGTHAHKAIPGVFDAKIEDVRGGKLWEGPTLRAAIDTAMESESTPTGRESAQKASGR